MKYIRLFELFEPKLFEPKEHEFNNKKYFKIYWLLPTDDRFENALNKINCYKEVMEIFLIGKEYKKEPYFFVGYNGSTPVNSIRSRWGWTEYEGKLKDDWYEEHEYEFGGSIDIPDWELDAKKYNL